MICVEVPVQTLALEIMRLQELDKIDKMESRHLYAQGAIDALKWLIDGGDSPSHNPDFPVFSTEH